jgi:inhibitor of KinA sporulation pathway (predicted exonuclease)
LESQSLNRQHTLLSDGDYDCRPFARLCQRQAVRYPFDPIHLNVKNLCALAHRLEHEVAIEKRFDLSGKLPEGTPHRRVDDAWNVAWLLLQVLGSQ